MRNQLKVIFSKIDLTAVYHQIKNDVAKTIVTIPFGLLKFHNMPFSLKNAAASFQRYTKKNIFKRRLRMHLLRCYFSFFFFLAIMNFSRRNTWIHHLIYSTKITLTFHWPSVHFTCRIQTFPLARRLKNQNIPQLREIKIACTDLGA